MENNEQIKAAVRISRAIEASAITVTIGLIFVSIALAQGSAQLILASIGGIVIVLMICGLTSKSKELEYYGMFDAYSKQEPSTAKKGGE